MQIKIMIYLLFFTIGCTTTQTIQKPSSVSIDTNQVRIHLTRKVQFHGGGVNFLVEDNGMKVGVLRNYGGELIWDRPAGKSCLTVRPLTNNRVRDRLCFIAKGGRKQELIFSANDGFHNFLQSDVFKVISWH